MRIPTPPSLVRLERISPSIYEAALNCKARASWAARSGQNQLPQHPAALLGMCFHAVVAAAHRGQLEPGSDNGRTSARQLFDRIAQSQYDEAHPLLRVKFPSVERLPFYNLLRERAVILAATSQGPSAGDPSRSEPPCHTSSAQSQTETALVSSDGLLVGRPDYLNEPDSEVVDYKTGVASEEHDSGVSESEARQLRLYVYLGLENNIRLSKGVIVRLGARRDAIDVPTNDAVQEGQRAKEVLQSFNDAVERAGAFEDLASPSPGACRNCACIPFCDAFWKAADPNWTEGFGAFVDGKITEISRSTSQGTPLLSVSVDARRGTVTAGRALIEQVPEEWVTADGSPLPKVGDTVRVVNGRLAASDELSVVRVDKTATTIWSAPSQDDEGA